MYINILYIYIHLSSIIILVHTDSHGSYCIGTSTTYTHIKTARLIDPLFGLWQTVDSEQSQ